MSENKTQNSAHKMLYYCNKTLGVVHNINDLFIVLWVLVLLSLGFVSMFGANKEYHGC